VTLRRLGSMLIAALASLVAPDEAAAQQDITGLWTDEAGMWKNSIAITQDQKGDVKMRVQPGAAFMADGHLDNGALTLTHSATEADLKNEKMCKYTGPKEEEAACRKLLKDKAVFSQEKPSTVSADGNTITLHYNEWSVTKEDGVQEPTVTPTDVPLILKRSISIKVHLPRAQIAAAPSPVPAVPPQAPAPPPPVPGAPAPVPAAPLAPDKSGRGVITLTNDGIDLVTGPFPAARLPAAKRTAPDPFELEDVDEGVLVDCQVRGAGARNLVQIDLAKDANLADGTVVLNVYQMVSLDGTDETTKATKATKATEHPNANVLPCNLPGPPKAGAAAPTVELPLESSEAVRLWSEDTQKTRLSWPYVMHGTFETLYIEGLKPGRYRLVLLYASDGVKTAADLKANEANPNGTPTPGCMKLLKEKDEYDFPPDNARLTVAKIDIFQDSRRRVGLSDINQDPKKARKHLFDVMWNGRAEIQGRLWPASGTYQFGHTGKIQQTPTDLPAHWVNISTTVDGDAFAPRPTPPPPPPPPGNPARPAPHASPAPRASPARPGPPGNPAGGATPVPLPAPPPQPATTTAPQAVAVVKGGFVVERGVDIGGRVVGSGLYDARLSLSYDVEGVHLIRQAPLTILVPSSVHIEKWGKLEQDAAHPDHFTGEGNETEITFEITYRLRDQNRRWMRLLDDKSAVLTYGATLRMWEALDGVTRPRTGGTPGNEILTARQIINKVPEIFWVFTSPTQAVNKLGTIPRARAVPFHPDDQFQDTFHVKIDMGMNGSTRNFYDQQMKNKGKTRANLLPGETVLEVTQDVVCVVDNGDALDDPGMPSLRTIQGWPGANVLVGATNRLQVTAPQIGPGGHIGNIGLVMIQGVLDDNQPTLVHDDHVPGVP